MFYLLTCVGLAVLPRWWWQRISPASEGNIRTHKRHFQHHTLWLAPPLQLQRTHGLVKLCAFVLFNTVTVGVAFLTKTNTGLKTEKWDEWGAEQVSDSLGPLTETLSAPLPAPLVKTLKSATSFTRTPLGCRPLPVARQAFGLIAERITRF